MVACGIACRVNTWFFKENLYFLSVKTKLILVHTLPTESDTM